jgi:hypothetical protein
MFDLSNGSFARKDAADGKEGCLHDGVHASTHARLFGHFITVDDIELELLLDDVLLYFNGKVVPYFVGAVKAVEQERGACPGVFEHIHTFEERELMTGNEVRLVQLDKVWCTDGLWTKPQMGHGHSAGLLRVIIEVALREVIGLFTDDLDRVLVCTNCTVCAETEEYTTDNVPFRFDHKGWIHFKAGMSDIVIDAYSEVILGFGLE